MSRQKTITHLAGLFAVATLASCATFRQGEPTFSLQTFDEIQIGSTRLDNISSLGQPARVFDDEPAGVQVLSFYEKLPGAPLVVTLRIEKSSNTIQMASWAPRITQPEATLDGVFKHYSGIEFKKQRVRHNYGHHFIDTDRYINSEHGIAIIYDPYKELVTHIYRAASKQVLPVVASTAGMPTVSILPELNGDSAN